MAREEREVNTGALPPLANLQDAENNKGRN